MNSATAHKFDPWWWLRRERNLLQRYAIRKLPSKAICCSQHYRIRGGTVGSDTVRLLTHKMFSSLLLLSPLVALSSCCSFLLLLSPLVTLSSCCSLLLLLSPLVTLSSCCSLLLLLSPLVALSSCYSLLLLWSPVSCYSLLSVGPSIILSATWSSLLYESKFITWILWNISCKDNVWTNLLSL